MKIEEINKKVKEIVTRLFEDGKRYGEDIGYAKDDALYELRINACDGAIEEIDKLLLDNKEYNE